MLRALARSYAWIGLFDKQEVKTVSDLQRKVGYDHHLLRDILKMAFISPKIQKAVIHGQEPPGLSLGKIYALKTDNWE